MKIKKLTYSDNIQKWQLSSIDFDNLTLLVGISGAGKTQILNSILSLRDIASGESKNGVEWCIEFVDENNTYKWEGKFESIEGRIDEMFSFSEEDEVKSKLEWESISTNGKIISKRNSTEITFEKKKMPKLAFDKSIIYLFKEEDSIKSIYEGFEKIVFRDHTRKEGTFNRFPFNDLKTNMSKYETLDDIRESKLDTHQKLACLYKNQKSAFQEIVDRYIDVFPHIENVKMEALKNENIHSFFKEVPILQFKEKGLDKWIYENRMSSGMIRTFIHISEMFLLSDGTLVLIDEFENSLGVNCIDILTEDLIFENNRLQFIVTSHHPYIINKIPYEYWKIVSRTQGKIETFNAKDYDLGASNHDAFMNLINLPSFKKGVERPL